MHKKKKARKGQLIKSIYKLSIIMIVLLYFISRTPPFFSQATNKTYIAEYGKIETVVSTDGYIARDEKIINTINEGEVVLLVTEGERVARGQKIATIHFNDLDDNITKDLEIINLRIANILDKQSEEQFFQSDIEKIDREIELTMQQIRQYIENGDFGKVSDLKETLSSMVGKKSIISGEKSFTVRNLEQLKRQQENLQEKVDVSVKTIISQLPGIISLGSDGLEDLLTLNNLDYMTLQKFGTIGNQLDTKTQQFPTDAIRIIESHRWSIVTKLKEREIVGLEEGKRVKIRIPGDSREYSSTVRNIIRGEDENCIIVLDLTEFVEDFYNKREILFDMIITSYEGVMIPNSAIIDKEEQVGVYRLDVNGFVRFIPVKIKGSNQQYSIIYNGYFDEINNNETRTVNTINYYDEIVVDAKKVNEGERIR